MHLNVMKDIIGKKIHARDGELGSVDDAYFDDERRAVRYFVVDTGDWLPGRKVLISPSSLVAAETGDDAVRVALTMDQVRHSPGADTAMPVSRQFEEAHARYYGYPFYWDGPYVWGSGQHPVGSGEPVTAAPAGESARERVRELKAAEQQARESHLRSCKEVAGYRVVATDGPLGHVEDFVVVADDWSLAKIEIDTSNWLPGGHVVVPASAIGQIDWITREVRIQATRDELKRSPKAS